MLILKIILKKYKIYIILIKKSQPHFTTTFQTKKTSTVPSLSAKPAPIPSTLFEIAASTLHLRNPRGGFSQLCKEC
jgi:hypothetical protein